MDRENHRYFGVDEVNVVSKQKQFCGNGKDRRWSRGILYRPQTTRDVSFKLCMCCAGVQMREFPPDEFIQYDDASEEEDPDMMRRMGQYVREHKMIEGFQDPTLDYYQY